jgi:hypothetical protein
VAVGFRSVRPVPFRNFLPAVRQGLGFETENQVTVDLIECPAVVGKLARGGEKRCAVGIVRFEQRVHRFAHGQRVLAVQFSQKENIAVYLLELFFRQPWRIAAAASPDGEHTQYAAQ